jgi:hypothetical protein
MLPLGVGRHGRRRDASFDFLNDENFQFRDAVTSKTTRDRSWAGAVSTGYLIVSVHSNRPSHSHHRWLSRRNDARQTFKSDPWTLSRTRTSHENVGS